MAPRPNQSYDHQEENKPVYPVYVHLVKYTFTGTGEGLRPFEPGKTGGKRHGAANRQDGTNRDTLLG